MRTRYININRIRFHWYSWAIISVTYITLSCLVDKVSQGHGKQVHFYDLCDARRKGRQVCFQLQTSFKTKIVVLSEKMLNVTNTLLRRGCEYWSTNLSQNEFVWNKLLDRQRKTFIKLYWSFFGLLFGEHNMGEGALILAKSLSLKWRRLGKEHAWPTLLYFLSISFRRTNKGPNKKLESSLSRYHYVPGLGKCLQVNTRAAL